MHLLVFLGELLAVELVFDFIRRRDEFLSASQDLRYGLLVITLNSDEESVTGFFCAKAAQASSTDKPRFLILVVILAWAALE